VNWGVRRSDHQALNLWFTTPPNEWRGQLHRRRDGSADSAARSCIPITTKQAVSRLAGAFANERIKCQPTGRVTGKARHAQTGANVKPIAGGGCAQIRTVTRPSRLCRLACCASANWIVVNVRDQGGSAISVHRDRTRARCEDRSQPTHLSIQPTGKTNMNALRETLERSPASYHDEVDVRAHQRIGEQYPIRMFKSAP